MYGYESFMSVGKFKLEFFNRLIHFYLKKNYAQKILIITQNIVFLYTQVNSHLNFVLYNDFDTNNI
jgi:hypothetical protein